jgi:hypothetical protein
MIRFSVVSLLLIIAILAIGLGLLANPSPMAVHITEGIAILCLTIGLLGAIARPAPRGGWQGFAVFGWVYFFLANQYFPSTITGGDMGGGQVIGAAREVTWRLPTARLIDDVIVLIHPMTRFPVPPTYSRDGQPIQSFEGLVWQLPSLESVPITDEESEKFKLYESQYGSYKYNIIVLVRARRIAHAQLGLVLGLFGANVGLFLARGSSSLSGKRQSPVPQIQQG